MDLVVRCRSFPNPGQTILAESSTEFCGGKGANQAVAAAQAGADVTMIGRVGSDSFADRLLQNLKDHHIGTENVQRIADGASGMAIISLDRSGQNSITVVPNANLELSETDVESYRDVIAASDVLMLQLEVPIQTVIAAIRIAKQSGVRVMLDPAPAPHDFPSDLLDVDLLCPNQSETSQLTSLPAESIEQAKIAANQLRSQGCQNVAITLGDQGTYLSSPTYEGQLPAFTTNVVDTTAAGDAFAGVLATCWAQQKSLPEAVRYANAAGAIAASRLGAQSSMPSWQEIEQLVSSQS